MRAHTHAFAHAASLCAACGASSDGATERIDQRGQSLREFGVFGGVTDGGRDDGGQAGALGLASRGQAPGLVSKREPSACRKRGGDGSGLRDLDVEAAAHVEGAFVVGCVRSGDALEQSKLARAATGRVQSLRRRSGDEGLRVSE